MENKKGSGIFLGVIGVATLLVAIIGATFAYFSATIAGTEQTLATAAVLKLGFKDDITGIKTNLIPSEVEFAQYAVENVGVENDKGVAQVECKDDNGNEICGVYDFTIGNPSFTTAQKIYGTLNVVTNDLPDLKFMVYLVTTDEDGDEVLTRVIEPSDLPEAGKGVALENLNQTLLPSSSDKENGSFVEDDPTTYTPITGTDDAGVASVNVRTYRMVVWIDETGEDQTETHVGSFSAGITFTSGTDQSSGVTGVIAAAQKAQENPTT